MACCLPPVDMAQCAAGITGTCVSPHAASCSGAALRSPSRRLAAPPRTVAAANARHHAAAAATAPSSPPPSFPASCLGATGVKMRVPAHSQQQRGKRGTAHRPQVRSSCRLLSVLPAVLPPQQPPLTLLTAPACAQATGGNGAQASEGGSISGKGAAYRGKIPTFYACVCQALARLCVQTRTPPTAASILTTKLIPSLPRRIRPRDVEARSGSRGSVSRWGSYHSSSACMFAVLACVAAGGGRGQLTVPSWHCAIHLWQASPSPIPTLDASLLGRSVRCWRRASNMRR